VVGFIAPDPLLNLMQTVLESHGAAAAP
jgi:hypothetical protein